MKIFDCFKPKTEYNFFVFVSVVTTNGFALNHNLLCKAQGKKKKKKKKKKKGSC